LLINFLLAYALNRPATLAAELGGLQFDIGWLALIGLPMFDLSPLFCSERFT